MVECPKPSVDEGAASVTTMSDAPTMSASGDDSACTDKTITKKLSDKAPKFARAWGGQGRLDLEKKNADSTVCLLSPGFT